MSRADRPLCTKVAGMVADCVSTALALQEILPRQKLLLDSTHWRSVLACIPDQEIQHSLATRCLSLSLAFAVVPVGRAKECIVCTRSVCLTALQTAAQQLLYYSWGFQAPYCEAPRRSKQATWPMRQCLLLARSLYTQLQLRCTLDPTVDEAGKFNLAEMVKVCMYAAQVGGG